MSVTSWPVRRWRIPSDGACRASRPDLPSSLLTPRTGRRPQSRPVRRRTVCDDGVGWGAATCSRRDTRQSVKRFGRGPIGGGGDSPLTHRVPGYRHDCAQSRGSNQPPPSSSIRARTSRFSAATNRSGVPAHTVVASSRCAAEQTHGHVEDALAGHARHHRRLRAAIAARVRGNHCHLFERRH